MESHGPGSRPTRPSPNIMESHRDCPAPTSPSSSIMESRRDCPGPRLSTSSDPCAPGGTETNCPSVSSGASSDTIIHRATGQNDESAKDQAQDSARASQTHSAPSLAPPTRTSSAPSPTVPTQSPGSVAPGHDGPIPDSFWDTISVRHFRPSTSVSSEDMPIRNVGVFRGTRYSPPENSESGAARTPTLTTQSSADFSYTTLYPISSEDEGRPEEEHPRTTSLRLARGREQVLNYLATASSSTDSDGLTSFEEGLGVPRPVSPSGSINPGGNGGLGRFWWPAFWVLLVLNIIMLPIHVLFIKAFFGIR